MNIKRSLNTFFAAVVMAVVFTACSFGNKPAGSEKTGLKATASSIEILGDGRIKAGINETFTESYYDVNELLAMVNGELADYNAAHGAESITLGDYSLENGVMYMSFVFKSADDYNNYMPDELYLGTVQGAYDKGYDFNRSLYKASASENSIGKKDLLERGSDRIAVLTGTSSIKLPDKIDYYSQGMTMTDKYTVTPDANGIYFVLY
ncbi:MAG: hypothetical protein K6C99_09640 [Lachnospiraceae bacterium]|nr:hypothetical protein [Lachnospiraceae bacterium]